MSTRKQAALVHVGWTDSDTEEMSVRWRRREVGRALRARGGTLLRIGWKTLTEASTRTAWIEAWKAHRLTKTADAPTEPPLSLRDAASARARRTARRHRKEAEARHAAGKPPLYRPRHSTPEPRTAK